MSRKPTKTEVQGMGWTGMFYGGIPGWFVSRHVTSSEPFSVHNENMKGETFYRCEITVRLVKDSRGRFITRKARP